MITPYYKDNFATLYHGDCREVLGQLTEDFDLLVTDPPYGQSYVGDYRKEAFAPIAGDDGSLDVPACLRAALKRLRSKRHLYVFGPIPLASLPIGEVAELIWDKETIGLGDLSVVWGKSFEPISFAVHLPSGQCEARKIRGGLSARLRRGSVLRCRRPSGHSGSHPTEKPTGLLRQLIESSSHLGETVLDPFAGAGSTLIAARLEGRLGVGIELDERYCEVAAKRLAGFREAKEA